MGLPEWAVSNFVRLRQRVIPDALTNENDEQILIYWVDLNGHLAAFFPEERTDFSVFTEGTNSRSLANAYIIGVVEVGDRLKVRYSYRGLTTETLDVVYHGFTGYRSRVQRFGDSALHQLNPDEPKPGIFYGGEIVYWKKIKHEDS